MLSFDINFDYLKNEIPNACKNIILAPNSKSKESPAKAMNFFIL